MSVSIKKPGRAPASPPFTVEPVIPPMDIASQGEENCAPTTGSGTSTTTPKGDKADDLRPIHINSTEES